MAAAAAADAEKEPLRLLYFDLGGKGDPIRVLCHYLGIKIDDDRVGKAPAADCDTPKDDRFLRYCDPPSERWEKLKESGECPYGQLPLLVLGKDDPATGKQAVTLCQSVAILRYLGRRSEGQKRGVYPADDALLQQRIDAVMEQEADAMAGVRAARYRMRFGLDLDDATASKALAENRATIVPKHLGYLEKMLAKSESGWLLDTEGPTIADFFWAPVVGSFSMGWPDPAFKDILAPFPKIQAFVAKYIALPEVASYYGL